MEQTTLAALDLTAMAQAFNLVYTDYLIPAQMSLEWLQLHFSANGIVPEHSPLWRAADGTIIGLAALGIRSNRGWVGGFGIAPAYRGRGLSHTLCITLLAQARALGLTQLQLEVLTKNAPAIRVYAQAGFVTRRGLRIYTATPDTHTPEVGRVRSVTVEEALKTITQLQQEPPCWQREPASLAAIPGMQALMLDTAHAALLYSASEQSVRLHHIAARSSADAAALVGALAAHLPERSMALINEPETSPVCVALERLGWRETIGQHEMFIVPG